MLLVLPVPVLPVLPALPVLVPVLALALAPVSPAFVAGKGRFDSVSNPVLLKLVSAFAKEEKQNSPSVSECALALAYLSGPVSVPVLRGAIVVPIVVSIAPGPVYYLVVTVPEPLTVLELAAESEDEVAHEPAAEV